MPIKEYWRKAKRSSYESCEGLHFFISAKSLSCYETQPSKRFFLGFKVHHHYGQTKYVLEWEINLCH